MVSDGIKAARIQARNSELNRPWAGPGAQAASVFSGMARAVGWNSGQASSKRSGKHVGKHAAPGRSFFSRSSR